MKRYTDSGSLNPIGTSARWQTTSNALEAVVSRSRFTSARNAARNLWGKRCSTNAYATLRVQKRARITNQKSWAVYQDKFPPLSYNKGLMMQALLSINARNTFLWTESMPVMTPNYSETVIRTPISSQTQYLGARRFKRNSFLLYLFSDFYLFTVCILVGWIWKSCSC